MTLDYLFPKRNMLAMRDARSRFVDRDLMTIQPRQTLRLEDGQVWRHRRTRSLARQMHGWLFYYYLRPFHIDLDDAIAEKLIWLLHTWRDVVGLPPSRIPMSYHDESTAQRTIALCCLLDDYGPLLSASDQTFVKDIIREGVDLLVQDEFHSAGTNHGMFQDLALMLASSYIDDNEGLYDLAFGRLTAYFKSSYTAEGVHKEQSPDYHVIVSRHLKEYNQLQGQQASTTEQSLREVFKASERYAIATISPLGSFAPVSDTPPGPVLGRGYGRVYNSDSYRYALTQGALGTPPDFDRFIADEAGVAIFREDWRDLDSLYLHFVAAYNSDYHKHSDELSVYLVYKGLEILREAGPNGYEMSDPYTIYAFSSFAHNTLIVDGEGLPRIDPTKMDKVGLQQVEQQGMFDVKGFNHRYEGVKHSRRVTVQPQDDQPNDAKRHVRIIDTIESADLHQYTLLWHFGPGVRARPSGDTVVIQNASNENLGHLRLRSEGDLKIVQRRGEETPDIQGWYFPKNGVHKPADVLQVEFSAATREVTTDIYLY
ncbi:heparinase II/III domain-containing protein [Auritidibacter ignavus]|uniref:heparinase II/III domain-containing protein n=1 Tax=Auritidibacter ignavus TaxID=678932 RepID=UPI0024B8983E|nr:heparinase II/III family protein [Auritidibacter ignavus]WHS28200.1 heparinase II/III family protein [Auritidibacter ignavus]